MKQLLYGLAAVLTAAFVFLFIVRSNEVNDIDRVMGQPTHSLGYSLGGLAVVLAVGAFGLALYFLPTILAWRGGDPRKNFTAIAALNFLLGWTLLGWVVALV